MKWIHLFIWIFIVLLYFLLIFEYYWLAWEWIVKTTCCLLKYDPKSLFVIVILILFCLYCEMLENHVNIYIWHGLSHLVNRLTDDPWSGASFDDIFICFLLCSISIVSSLLWFLFVLGSYPNAWAMRKKTRVWLWTPTRIRCHQRAGRVSM